MNIISKVFCRIYQGAFRMALPLLPYREPKRFKQIGEAVALLEEQKVQSVLLITDKGIRQNGITASLEEKLKNNGIHVAVEEIKKLQSEKLIKQVKHVYENVVF